MEVCPKFIFLSFILGFIQVAIGEVATKNDSATAFRTELLKDYDKMLSPILFGNTSDSYKEMVYLFIFRIQNLDESSGVLSLESAVSFSWLDYRLKWNREERSFWNLKFRSDEVWTPALNLLNRAMQEEKKIESTVISFAGFMWWGRAFTLHTTCIPNLKYFPFDVQHCDIEIAALTQNGDIMDFTDSSPKLVQMKYYNIRNYTENPLWQLENVTTRSKQRILKDGQNISAEVFTLSIRRTSPIIATGIMTTSMISVLLILTSFWIQPGNSIRTGITMTSVIVSSSTLFTLAKILPVTGDATPIIVEYATTAVILTMLSSIHTIIMSVLIRMTLPFPFPYALMISRVPSWALILLCLKPASETEAPMDQVLLFSELSEKSTLEEPRRIIPSQLHEEVMTKPDCNPISTHENLHMTLKKRGEWMLPVILLDRVSFYAYLITCGLFTISVMIKE